MLHDIQTIMSGHRYTAIFCWSCVPRSMAYVIYVTCYLIYNRMKPCLHCMSAYSVAAADLQLLYVQGVCLPN